MLLQEKAKARKQSGTFLIEGLREIELAIQGGYELETILFLPELISEKQITKFTNFALLSFISALSCIGMVLDPNTGKGHLCAP